MRNISKLLKLLLEFNIHKWVNPKIENPIKQLTQKIPTNIPNKKKTFHSLMLSLGANLELVH